MTRLAPCWRPLAALLLVVGIVLLPLRAVAATIPALIAYDAAVGSTATVRVEERHAVRSEAEPRGINTYDGVDLPYGDPSNLHVTAGTGGAPAYGDPTNPRVAAGTAAVRVDDGDLDHLHRRELRREGVIYDAPVATTAAEGASAVGTFATTAERAAVLDSVVTSEGALNTSQTVAGQLAAQRSFIPTQSILDTIGSGVRVADPQGVALPSH